MPTRPDAVPPPRRVRPSAAAVCAALLLAVFSAFAMMSSAFARTDAPDVTLMMVEEPGCHFCRKWHAEIGPGYPSTAEGRFAPLKRVVGRGAPELKGLAPVIYTPTFIVMREGRELGRLPGYPGAEYFYPELKPLLAAAGFAPATTTTTDRISAP